MINMFTILFTINYYPILYNKALAEKWLL